MAVIVIADVQGQTPEGYDGMLDVLADIIKKAEGFIAHAAYPVDDRHWCTLEMWRTKEEANKFFAQHIAPNLPPGVRPKRSMYELHNVITRPS